MFWKLVPCSAVGKFFEKLVPCSAVAPWVVGVVVVVVVVVVGVVRFVVLHFGSQC